MAAFSFRWRRMPMKLSSVPVPTDPSFGRSTTMAEVLQL
jgi:hypothetical protein